MQTGVLNVIGGHRLLSFDLYINVHADSSRHSRFVCALVCEEHSTYSNTVTELKTSESEKLGHSCNCKLFKVSIQFKLADIKTFD